MVQRDDPDYDDAAWRAIVDNYGERAELDLPADPEAPAVEEQADEPVEDPVDEQPDEPVEEDRFVPDQPPPVPVPPADRLLAWLGVFGSPTVLLVFVILGIGLPGWLTGLLVAGFVGGFCYLVIRSPGSPRDPWDDGARV